MVAPVRWQVDPNNRLVGYPVVLQPPNAALCERLQPVKHIELGTDCVDPYQDSRVELQNRAAAGKIRRTGRYPVVRDGPDWSPNCCLRSVWCLHKRRRKQAARNSSELTGVPTLLQVFVPLFLKA